MTYDNTTLSAVKRAWGSFKDSTGTSQAVAAKAMGMNQSALSQYLRGDIPLNTDFLSKFSGLTGADLGGTPLQAGSPPKTIELRWTLSGRKLKNRVVVTTGTADCSYGVVIDQDGTPYGNDAILTIQDDSPLRDGDQALLLHNDSLTFGSLKWSRDTWVLVKPYWGSASSIELDGGEVIHRVTGVFWPDRKGKVFNP